MRNIMTCDIRLLLPTLLAAAALSAADPTPAPAPKLSNSPTRKLPLGVEDPAQVAKATLYVTSDGGATWNVAQELVPSVGETPAFTFTAPVDGVYGFIPAVTYKNGEREAAPRPGQIPQVVYQIDTTPPAVDRFSARVEAVVGSNVNVRLSWTISDALPAEQPVTIEISVDGGTTFAPLQRTTGQGNLLASVPAPAVGQHLAVRLRAQDKAGNQTLSAVTLLDPATVTAAPEAAPAPAPTVTNNQALAQALAALPVVESPAVHATPAPALAPAEPPRVTVARPDIIEPNKPIPPPLKASDDVEIVREGGLEQEYRQARAAEQGTHAPAWQESKDGPSHLITTPSEPERAPAHAAAPSLPPGVPPAGTLSPSQTKMLLVQAREAALAGSDATALLYYRRLRNSSFASQAILEELQLLRQRNRTAEALVLLNSLPTTQIDDALRIEQGRLLIASARPHEALAPLTAVRNGSAQADEALFVIAQALAADGKADQAKKVYTAVAKGSGPWAKAAQQQLAGR